MPVPENDTTHASNDGSLVDFKKPSFPQVPRLKLLQAGTSSASAGRIASAARLATHYYVFSKKLVAPGPGRAPVEILEATSPRGRDGIDEIKADYYEKRNDQIRGAAQEKPQLRTRSLPRKPTEATLRSLPNDLGRSEPIREWLSNMDVPENTQYAAMALADEAERETMCSSDEDFSDFSTVGGDGGTFVLVAQRFGRQLRRKPFQFLRHAAVLLLRAFRSPVVDAGVQPASFALQDCEEIFTVDSGAGTSP